jgi:NhaP-type Na+/H+ or K+/H+ antiporter
VSATLWFVVVGALLLGMGVTTTYIKRLPLTTAMIYAAVGYLMDPAGVSFAALDPVRHPHLLERITEIAVIVSLFTAGLKLRAPFHGHGADRRWVTPVLLATVSMVVTVAAVTGMGVWGLGLPVGAAVLLGAILAPTDPVLASDVQVEHPEDQDRLRFSLTGEAGLNDGTAFPFVMLGLGLLGHHDIGPNGLRWAAVDLVWAVVSGVGVGALCGWLVGRLVLHLRGLRHESVGTDDLIALGLIGLSYGLALLVKGYGFLAVFAAGLALRRAEEAHAARVGDPRPTAHGAGGTPEGEQAAGAREDAPRPAGAGAPASEDGPGGARMSQPYMVRQALGATEQVERIGEAAVLVILGGLFTNYRAAWDAWWFIGALFFIARPLAVWILPSARRAPAIQRRMAMWFGVRGVGSVYYLTYAISHGVSGSLAERLTALTFTTLLASLVVHGLSVTPLMKRYERVRARRGVAAAPA